MEQKIKEKIEAGNKEMAKFLGYKYFPYDPEKDLGRMVGWLKSDQKIHPLEKAYSHPNYLCRKTRDMRFFNEWNWLMRVVEKIETIYDAQHGYFGVHIISNQCTIQGTKLHLALKDTSYGSVYFDEQYDKEKIKATWAACLNFINWFNEEFTKK